MPLGLGLDTGGTYTDAVILDLGSGGILQKAKALTTKEDLIIGIENAISGFDPDLLKQISLVSLSSTLATNSIVEGKGCRVGLLCIGRDFNRSIRIDNYVKVGGRHDINGNETEPLDEKAVLDFIHDTKDLIDCIAVTGYMSVRNPEHEMKVRDIIANATDKPVVCGYHLSSILGFNERAVTAVMNARLIPVIKDLITSVEKVMIKRGIDAPIMIVRGDGSITNVKVAEERPVETILCGPAASMTGAKVLTELEDAIVVDVGGTTTDIGILKNGFPRIAPGGATIGGHRTHVMAAEISISGIGGDSRILLNGTKMSLTSLRVIPLCIAASKWPEILDDLADAVAYPHNHREAFDERNAISDIEFFTVSKPMTNESLSNSDKELLALLKYRPLSLRRAGSILNIEPVMFNIDKMEEAGLIQRIGLSPTDILHFEGSYTEYNAKASEYGVEYVSKRLRITKKDLVSRIKEMVYEKISSEILKKVISDEVGSASYNEVTLDLIHRAISRRTDGEYACSITLKNPIIGIGAPVNAWLPEVAKRLNTEFVHSENSKIGNAIGAISGCIVESIDMLIEPDVVGLNRNVPCTVYSKMGRVAFDTLEDGINYAKDAGRKFAESSALTAGASAVNITYEVKERTFNVEGARAIIDITITVTAAGKPPQMI